MSVENVEYEVAGSQGNYDQRDYPPQRRPYPPARPLRQRPVPQQAENKRPAFQISDRDDVILTLDIDLAVCLGRFLVDVGSDNKAIMALGHRLANLDSEYE